MNPGSDAAKAAGCRCPDVINRGGEGMQPKDTTDEMHFMINKDCALHGSAVWMQEAPSGTE